MQARINKYAQRGMTFIEGVAVAAVLFILLVVLWPRSVGAPANAKRINCLSQLKAIGLSFRMWSNDNGDKFPWQVPVATNGTLEFAESPEVFRHFLAISNELSSTKVLACASDTEISRVSDFVKLNNAHLSYFVGLEANEAFPQTILSGDRNILGGTVTTNSLVRFDSQSPAHWGTELHNRQGNIGLSDGSALQFTDNSLRKQIEAALLSTNVGALRFSIPKPN